MTTQHDRIAALITAAGASRRMGRAKALVEWGGVPLLVHQVRVARAVLGDEAPIVAVLGSEAGAISAALSSWPELARVILVDNLRWQEGRSSSFEVGVAALPGRAALDGLLVAAVDQPLEVTVVRALVAARDASGAILAPTHAGRRGHPLLLGPDAIARLAEAGRYPQGLRDIVRRSAVREVAVASASIHRDLNTPEDLG